MKRALLAVITALILATPSAAETVEKSFPVGGGGKLVIDLETGGSVTVTGSGRSEVHVVASLRDYDPGVVDFAMSSSGSTVNITTKLRRRSHRESFSYEFEIQVPDRFDVSIDSMGGSLTIQEVEGRFTGETMGGDLRLHSVRGQVNLTTMGGTVEVQDAFIDGSISTMGGSLSLVEVEGDLTAKTMGGNIRLDAVSGEVHAETMGGNVEQTRSGRGRDSDGPVRLKTMGGQIKVDFAPEGADVETMGGDIQLGTVAGFARATTKGGNIIIREIDGRVDATTMGGAINVTVANGGGAANRDIDLESKSGAITLHVPEDLSMNLDVEIVWTRRHKAQPRIISDFPLRIEESTEFEYDRQGHDGDRSKLITGAGSHLGGRNNVRIRTVNGDVRIIKDRVR
jgi:DUF4097 and DUF4098 domain-containing protein YvlB